MLLGAGLNQARRSGRASNLQSLLRQEAVQIPDWTWCKGLWVGCYLGKGRKGQNHGILQGTGRATGTYCKQLCWGICLSSGVDLTWFWLILPCSKASTDFKKEIAEDFGDPGKTSRTCHSRGLRQTFRCTCISWPAARKRPHSFVVFFRERLQRVLRKKAAVISYNTSSHLRICWSTSSHPHICWSTSSHPHICWSTSSHPHTCWSTSSHLHICWSTSSHLHICWSTSSHPHICWSTSSHPHICRPTSSHLHICWSTSSHPHICRSTSSHLCICWTTSSQTVLSFDS